MSIPHPTHSDDYAITVLIPVEIVYILAEI